MQKKNCFYKMLTKLFGITFLVNITGCSQESSFKTYDPPEVPNKIVIAFIGNSLTLHPSKSELGWEHNNGMAASNKDKDYVHRLLSELKIKEEDAYIRNSYPFETEPSIAEAFIRSIADVIQKKPEIVIIQLGDNVAFNPRHPINSVIQTSAFSKTYSALITAFKNETSKIYCVSTWWESKVKDYIIKKSCEKNGGTYIYIGDIRKDANNPDTKKIDFTNKDVDAHPKDWGMNQISWRLKKSISNRTSAP